MQPIGERRMNFGKGMSWAIAVAVLVVVTGACRMPAGEPSSHQHGMSGAGSEIAPGQDAETLTMVQRLHGLTRDAGRGNAFTPEAMVELYSQIEEPPDIRSQVQLQARWARALLYAGRSQEAVDKLRLVRRQMAEHPRLFKETFVESVLALSAIASLRLGEQQNCLHAQQAASCLLPITAEGVHRDQQGARQAMELYGELLRRRPQDLEARWLLNLAAMAVGEHPQGVDSAHVIAAEAFAPEAAMPPFPDVASAAGLDVVGLSGGVVLEDFDGDGWLDVMVSSWGFSDPLRLFRHRGAEGRGAEGHSVEGHSAKSFIEVTEAAGLGGLNGGLNLVAGDYDNDGLTDVLVLRGAWMGENGHHANSLLHNEGGLKFVDRTESAGLLDFYPTQTAAWGDYDGDGWLDLFVGNETSGAHAHPSRLFHNLQDGRFEEVTAAVGVAVEGYVKAVAWGDYDNDGRPDLYLSRLGQDNVLLRNEGPASGSGWHFRDVSVEAGVQEPRNSFPAWFFDYDNDGWLDIFVSGYPVDIFAAGAGGVAEDYLGLDHGSDETPRLYRNRGDGRFEDVTAAVGLDRILYTMGSNFGDLDNDGWKDLYLGTGAPDFSALMPNRMFRNGVAEDGGRRFFDVTSAARVGHLQKGHGVAFGDLDNDGDQDIYAVMGGAYSGDVFANALFENPGPPSGHHWLGLHLQGVASNRSGLGARLHLRLRTPGGERHLHHLVSTGGSFGSASTRQQIGLGEVDAIELLEAHWPSGQVDLWHEVPFDRYLLMREGDDKLRPWAAASSP